MFNSIFFSENDMYKKKIQAVEHAMQLQTDNVDQYVSSMVTARNSRKVEEICSRYKSYNKDQFEKNYAKYLSYLELLETNEATLKDAVQKNAFFIHDEFNTYDKFKVYMEARLAEDMRQVKQKQKMFNDFKKVSSELVSQEKYLKTHDIKDKIKKTVDNIEFFVKFAECYKLDITVKKNKNKNNTEKVFEKEELDIKIGKVHKSYDRFIKNVGKYCLKSKGIFDYFQLKKKNKELITEYSMQMSELNYMWKNFLLSRKKTVYQVVQLMKKNIYRELRIAAADEEYKQELQVLLKEVEGSNDAIRERQELLAMEKKVKTKDNIYQDKFDQNKKQNELNAQIYYNYDNFDNVLTQYQNIFYKNRKKSLELKKAWIERNKAFCLKKKEMSDNELFYSGLKRKEEMKGIFDDIANIIKAYEYFSKEKGIVPDKTLTKIKENYLGYIEGVRERINKYDLKDKRLGKQLALYLDKKGIQVELSRDITLNKLFTDDNLYGIKNLVEVNNTAEYIASNLEKEKYYSYIDSSFKYQKDKWGLTKIVEGLFMPHYIKMRDNHQKKVVGYV